MPKAVEPDSAVEWDAAKNAAPLILIVGRGSCLSNSIAIDKNKGQGKRVPIKINELKFIFCCK
jgi:hypothetical protein